MAKKKTGKVIQMLSPENYIRTKARTLPIHECLVNAEWKEEGIANIIVARKHTTGNMTVCFYMVDLFCLGVKDTHYMFNISHDEYQDVITNVGDIEIIPITYTLAHNIIYAGIEYAEELGFKPNKDFTSITRFMLEEDTDDVEFMDIECGKDGKPFYISGPDDTDLTIKTVTKQLEKSAGTGNYEFLNLDNDDEFDRENEDDEDLEDEFKDYTFEEKKKLFADLESRKETLNEEEAMRFIELSDSIFEDITDTELFDKYCYDFNEDFDIDVTDDKIPDELLGILPGSTIIKDETRNLFLQIYNVTIEDTFTARKLLEKFKKQTSDIPASYLLELLILQEEDSSDYIEKLNEYSNKFPDYPMIRMLQISASFSSDGDTPEYPDQTFRMHSLFPGRTELNTIEMIHYVVFNLSVLSHLGDASRLNAFIYISEVLELNDEDVNTLDTLAGYAKMHLVYNYLHR